MSQVSHLEQGKVYSRVCRAATRRCGTWSRSEWQLRTSIHFLLGGTLPDRLSLGIRDRRLHRSKKYVSSRTC